MAICSPLPILGVCIDVNRIVRGNAGGIVWWAVRCMVDIIILTTTSRKERRGNHYGQYHYLYSFFIVYPLFDYLLLLKLVIS